MTDDRSRPDLRTLMDWLEGRLETARAEEVARAVATGDEQLTSTAAWAKEFLEVASAHPLERPPPIVRQRLGQHFRRWAESAGAAGRRRYDGARRADLRQPRRPGPRGRAFGQPGPTPCTWPSPATSVTSSSTCCRASRAWSAVDGQILVRDPDSPFFEVELVGGRGVVAFRRRRRARPLRAGPRPGRPGATDRHQRSGQARGRRRPGRGRAVNTGPRVPGSATESAREVTESAVDVVRSRADEVESLLHVDPAAAEALAHETIVAAAEAGLAEIQGRLDLCAGQGAGRARRPARGVAPHRRGQGDLAARRASVSSPCAPISAGCRSSTTWAGTRSRWPSAGALLAGLAEPTADPQLVATLKAAALGNVGVAHSFLGSHDESRICYDRSAAIYAELGMPIQVAQQRANSGIELLALGRARDAVDALRRSEEEFRDGGDRLWAAKCSVHVADAHRQLGDVVPALAALHQAGAELLELGAVAEEARVHLQLGRVYLEAGLLPEATDSARRARALFESAAMSHDAAFARLVLASAHLQGQHLDAAETEAWASVREFEAVGDQQFRARATLLAAQVAHARSDPRAAGLLDEAVALLAAGGWTLPLAWAQVEVAERGGPGAPAALEAAAALAEQLMIPELTHAVALVNAREARRAGRLEEAITGLRRCVDDVDLRGRALVDPLLRLASANEATSAHDLLIDLLVERAGPGDAAAALAVSDAAKSQILREVASAPHADGAWGPTVPGAEADRVMRDLHATYTALSSVERSADRDRLLEDARGLEGRLGGLRLQAVAAGSLSTLTTGTGGHEEPLVGPAVSFHIVGADVIAFLVRPDGEVTASPAGGRRREVRPADEAAVRPVGPLRCRRRVRVSPPRGARADDPHDTDRSSRRAVGTDLRGARHAAGHRPDDRPAPPAARRPLRRAARRHRPDLRGVDLDPCTAVPTGGRGRGRGRPPRRRTKTGTFSFWPSPTSARRWSTRRPTCSPSSTATRRCCAGRMRRAPR